MQTSTHIRETSERCSTAYYLGQGYGKGEEEGKVERKVLKRGLGHVCVQREGRRDVGGRFPVSIAGREV